MAFILYAVALHIIITVVGVVVGKADLKSLGENCLCVVKNHFYNIIILSLL